MDDIFGLLDQMTLKERPATEEELNPFAWLRHTPETHPWEFTENGEVAPFRLLDLPREVRDKVYNYSLQSPASGNPYRHSIGQLQQRVYRWGPPSIWCSYYLLSTNNQVYDEALPFLYSPKLFIFKDHEMVVSWMKKRSERARGLIKHLGIEFLEDSLRYTSGSYTHRVLTNIGGWTQYLGHNLRLDYFAIEIHPKSSRFIEEEYHEDMWVSLMFGMFNLNIPAVGSLEEFEMYYRDEPRAMHECSMYFIRGMLCRESSKATTSSFLNLPFNVRWNIYELLLRSSQKEYGIHEHASEHPTNSTTANVMSEVPQRAPFRIAAEHPQDMHPAILATCHRIHEEATPILYTGNRLLEHVTDPASKAWVQAAYGRRMAKHAERIARKRYLFK